MAPEDFDLFLSQFRSKRSARTTATYGAVLTAFGLYFADRPAPPSVADIEAFLARRERKIALSSRNVELAALRAFSTFAVRHLGWQTDPTEGISFERVPPTSPVVLDRSELHRLFLAADALRGFHRPRALAVLAVLSQVGLRVHELAALNVAQVDLETATLLAVRGKGDTCHDLPLSVPACALLRDWLGWRIRSANPGEPALLVTHRGRRMSVRSIQKLLAVLREAMGTGKRVTPHALRHTAATQALLNGCDLATVGELLRHSRLETTRRYLHCVDTRRRDAVKRLAGGVPSVLFADQNLLDAQDDLGAIQPVAEAALQPSTRAL